MKKKKEVKVSEEHGRRRDIYGRRDINEEALKEKVEAVDRVEGSRNSGIAGSRGI